MVKEFKIVELKKLVDRINPSISEDFLLVKVKNTGDEPAQNFFAVATEEQMEEAKRTGQLIPIASAYTREVIQPGELVGWKVGHKAGMEERKEYVFYVLTGYVTEVVSPEKYNVRVTDIRKVIIPGPGYGPVEELTKWWWIPAGLAILGVGLLIIPRGKPTSPRRT